MLRQQIFNIILVYLIGTLLLSALIYESWGCGGRIFSFYCIIHSEYRILGLLLLASFVIIAMCGLMSAMELFKPKTWSDKASIFCSIVSTALTTSTVGYYHYFTGEWLPCLASVAMAISILQVITLTLEYNKGVK